MTARHTLAFGVALIPLVIVVSAIMLPVSLHAQNAPAGSGTGGGEQSGGEAAFNNACRTCHSIKPGDNRLGPSLAGIVGKKAGLSEGFAYSQSLKTSGVTWDAKTLDALITNPDAVVPGNNMKPYTGISDAAVRAKIVAYLEGAK